MSFIQSLELRRLVQFMEKPDQETGRAFSYLYAIKWLRRCRHFRGRSLFQIASTMLRP